MAIIMIDNSPSNSDKKTMKMTNNKIPTITNPNQITTSINDMNRNPPPPKISSIISSIVTQTIQIPNTTIKNHSFIRMTLNLRDLNRIHTLKLQHTINKTEEVPILKNLQGPSSWTTIQQATNVTNNIQIINTQVHTTRGPQSKNNTP